MQTVCRFSRRWHQQFCHSPSFTPHRKCIQGMIPVREYRQATRRIRKPIQNTAAVSAFNNPTQFRPSDLLRRSENDLVVREFEQHGSDESTRVRVDPGEALDNETTEVLRELEDVDHQLSVLKQGPFGPQSDFMQELPSEQRELLLQALADEGLHPQDEEDTLDLAELDRLMEEEEQNTTVSERLVVSLKISRAHRALVNHFNKALAQAFNNKEDTLKVLTLWKWYLRCQKDIPEFSKYIPDRVLNFLWRSQSDLKVRQTHLVVLGRDFLTAGKILQADQYLEYIEALHTCGDTAAAISSWEDLRTRHTHEWSSDFVSSLYSTGIQLYSAIDRPMKAQNIASSALEKGVSPKILFRVIESWARAKAPVKAWSSYLRMQALFRSNIPPDLYEKVSDVLLDSNHTDLALAVFKDLVATVRGSGDKTLEGYRKSLGKMDLTGDPEEIEQAINQLSLTLLTALPQQYRNKYFFASWIKKLIGQERVEAASMVVDLMYERGIKPDPIHLNGIIGAWLREGSPFSQEKASKLAWDMIQARINHVQNRMKNSRIREIGNVFRKVMPYQEGDNMWMKPTELERPVPAANIETFSLLFDYSEQRLRWQDFERLTQIMVGPAQLIPNNYIVNKWLNAQMQEGQSDKFWALFSGLEGQVKSNLETYSLAWQMVAMQHGMSPSKRSASYRQIFAKIMDWQACLASRDRREVKSGFQQAFYQTIIRSFSYQRDLPDTICAIQGMYAAFKLTPDDASIQLITGQVAAMLQRQSTQPVPSGRRQRRNHIATDQTMLKEIADIVGTIEAKHKLDLLESGQAQPEELEDPSSNTFQKLRLDVMTEFLVLIMQRTKKEADNPAKNLRDVAKVMHVGVSHIDMEAALS